MTGLLPDLLLDISRTVSRLGAGGDSGVDRVERAYIRHLMTLDRPVYFLSRVMGGVALLDKAGMTAILAQADALPGPDLWGHAARQQSPHKRRAEAAMRRHALTWTWRSKTAECLRRHITPGFHYVNVGHTHLDQPHLAAVRAGGAGKIAVLIHDVIPLDYPEFSRPETPARFEALLKGVAQGADLLIYNSQYTAQRCAHWLQTWGLAPAGVTALLGVEPLQATAVAPAQPPYFVALGTIEPRKNHLLLLSIWRQFHDTLPADRIPQLHIIGRRGWENENILDILDRAPFMGRCVFEHGFLSDAELAQRLGGATALLFPSFVEGFGYPLAEALQMGVPAICADLPVYREIAATGPTYLDPLDGPAWKSAIASVAQQVTQNKTGATVQVQMPTWQAHFDKVFDQLDGTDAKTAR